MNAPKDSELFGRTILGYYAERQLGAGDMLTIESLSDQWFEMNGRPEDFANGLQWLFYNGYLTRLSGNDDRKLFLTEAGCGAIHIAPQK